MRSKELRAETKASLHGQILFLPRVPPGSFLMGLAQVRPSWPRWDLSGFVAWGTCLMSG